MEIPKGKSRPEIKIREQIIKDFYAKWISENPSKSMWNKSLRAEIKVKGLSYNETIEHAARSYRYPFKGCKSVFWPKEAGR